MSEKAQTKESPRFNFVLGLISGPTIYMIHFLVVYFLVEWGCRSGLYRTQVLGFSIVSVLIVILTLIAASVTAVATWFSFRRWQAGRHVAAAEEDSYRKFLGFAGMGLNGYSTILILLTGLPTLSLVMCEWI